MSTPIGGSNTPSHPQVPDPNENGSSTSGAPSVPAQPGVPATTASSHSLLGALAQRATRTGAKAAQIAKGGLGKAEPVMSPAASGGYELWAGNNATSAVNGLVSNFHGTSEVTSNVSQATNGVGMLPAGLDVATTAVSFGNKLFKVAETSKQLKSEVPGTLAGNDALSAHKQARGNLARATPGAIRDVGIGALGVGGRIYAAGHQGHSMYGGKSSAVTADGVLAIASGAAYTIAGVQQSRKVDRAVDRVQAVRSAVRQPASGRTESHSEAMRQLDDAFADDKISSHTYWILRQHDDADVERFHSQFAALGIIGRQRFNEVLQFPGEKNLFQVFNLGRNRNLNTASMRRAAREEVIDAFLRSDIQPGQHAELFDELKSVRNEALGAKTAPKVAALKDSLRDAEIDPGQFNSNTLKAIAASGEEQAFVARYKTLPQDERARLQSTLHFGTWRFWKKDATLPTTKLQRSDIRAALVKQFANGASLDRLEAMKVRYNQKVLPLQSGRTHPQNPPADLLRTHILAYQDTTLDSLKEEKRHANIQVAYGAVNAAAGIAELAVNPLAGAGISATRAVLSPAYLAYAGRRGLVSEINRRNARPINAAMQEEALLYALPSLHQRIATGGADLGRLRDRQQFLHDELKLSIADINKVETLKLSGKGDEVRAFLAQKNPEANALVALRVVAEEAAGYGYHQQIEDAKRFIGEAASTSGIIALNAVRQDSRDPDKTFETLKTHFIDNASFQPASGIDALAHALSTAPTAVNYGFDTARYVGQPAQDVASDLRQRFAQDNPSFATRLFVGDLFSSGREATAARNMLRDFRFSETEIGQLQAMGKKDAGTWLEGHLFGENLRRRFSTQLLNQQGHKQAAAVAERMPEHQASAEEPLTWRRNLEAEHVNVIDNPSTPGLDSMLHALGQQFSGKTDSASSAMNRKVVEARRRVTAAVTDADPDSHVDVTQHRDTIVQIAAQVFGKPGATVTFVQASGEGLAERIGAGHDDPDAPVAGVLCYDAQTRRSFTLHGGDVGKLPTPAPNLTLPGIQRSPLIEQSVLNALGMAPQTPTAPPSPSTPTANE
jgi:hypothetical protein